MGNKNEDSSSIQKINSIAENLFLQQIRIKENEKVINKLHDQEQLDFYEKKHKLENEKAKIEFTEMGVVSLFTKIIDSRVLSSLKDKPEYATYNFWMIKKVIEPAYFCEKETIRFGKDMVRLDLLGRTDDKGEISDGFSDFEGPSPFYGISRISVMKRDNDQYVIEFEQNFDTYLCDGIDEGKMPSHKERYSKDYKEKVIEKDEVVNTLIIFFGKYVALKKQRNLDLEREAANVVELYKEGKCSKEYADMIKKKCREK